MNTSKLLAFFDARRERGESLVLAVVTETGGSTYSKVGDLLLIDANGVVCGMLSGGCLETDLAARALAVLATNTAQVITYELGGDDDEIWGLGTGCDGMMCIHLQPVTAGNDYAPLSELRDGMIAGQAVALDLEAPDSDESAEILIPAAPRVLIVGMGADAEPLARHLDNLGFLCDLADHRPALVDPQRFPASAQLHMTEMSALADAVDLTQFDGAVVMTHQLASDRACLKVLASSPIPYVGLLGPAPRRTRLLEELGELADALADRVEGPAGLDLGGRGPEAIALSIAARLQQVIASRPVAADHPA